MPHADYLSRSPMKYKMLHELEEPNEDIFIGQISLSRKAKYIMAFIYNAYRSWMSVKTDQRKEIYGLHQSSEGGVKLRNSNNLEIALRELREKTGLRVY